MVAQAEANLANAQTGKDAMHNVISTTATNLSVTDASIEEARIVFENAEKLMNMGTNYLLGKISFISDSVAVVLQLALAIDYAIILCHRYCDERELLPAKEAVISALSKSIPEISASSMTTISGLAALGFMEFGIPYPLTAKYHMNLCGIPTQNIARNRKSCELTDYAKSCMQQMKLATDLMEKMLEE